MKKTNEKHKINTDDKQVLGEVKIINKQVVIPQPLHILSGRAYKIKSSNNKRVVVLQLINQAKFELIGAIWTDAKGKIHYVGLVEKHGQMLPDFPSGENVYIADVAQVGIER